MNRLQIVAQFFLGFGFYISKEGQREMNPVGRGRYTAGKGFGGTRAKGLIPRFTKLPWIPTDAQWQMILVVARQERIRNRMMLALALPGLAFALYLARIEAHVLGVWCVYCVISLGTISLITMLLLALVVRQLFQDSSAEA